MEARLTEYARLTVRTGVNLREDQPLVINAPIECADFARRLAREAYQTGARDVTIVWSDERFSRLRFEMATEEALASYPDWRRRLYMDNAEENAAIISIHAENPEAFRGVAPERLVTAQQAAGEALLEYRARIMASKNAWCVVSVPTAAWARKVFSDKSDAEAVDALWEAIFSTVRVSGDGGAVERWKRHTDFLSRAAAFMNGYAFVSLHYKNSLGTDLTVHLPESHIWAGGAEETQAGRVFVANLPTEEIYTLPHRDGVDGMVVATKPLVFQGNLITGMKLRFEAGKVVSFEAETGRAHLQTLLETDEGAAHLGEVALVPYDSPISKSGILFYNTLFDENASCHLAFGKAYPTCLAGGADMDTVTLLSHGVNDSLLHEDFMVGSRDLSITGRTKDGKEIPVFRDGNFVEF
ncbi:MAG: aminopeptidase [Schwartzia sp.]|nr:aminopeptidase [Schwartzia sp. (in: firmicutes)]